MHHRHRMQTNEQHQRRQRAHQRPQDIGFRLVDRVTHTTVVADKSGNGFHIRIINANTESRAIQTTPSIHQCRFF